MLTLRRLALPALAIVLAISPVTAQPGYPDRGRRDDRERHRAEIDQIRAELAHYQQAYNELSAGLDQIERLNRRNRDRRLMWQMNRAIRDAYDRAGQYVQPWSYEQQQPDWRDDDDWRRVRDRRTDPRPPSMPAPTAMNDRDFRALADQVGRAAFADDKLAVVQTAAQTNFFTVAQVVALMQLASFDDTRVEIAVTCAPRVLDGDRWFEVYGALTFSSSRETLRSRVGGR
jgi:hypothetical protein